MGTVVVGAIVVVIAGLAVRSIVKDKKSETAVLEKSDMAVFLLIKNRM